MPASSPLVAAARRHPVAPPLVKTLLLHRINLLLAYGPEDEFAMNALWNASDQLGQYLQLLAARTRSH